MSPCPLEIPKEMIISMSSLPMSFFSHTSTYLQVFKFHKFNICRQQCSNQIWKFGQSVHLIYGIKQDLDRTSTNF